MIRATPDQQRRLLDLQEVDNAIRQLEFRRANLAEQKALDDNAVTLQRVGAELVAHRERLERLEREQRKNEEDIGLVESRRKSEEGRMYSGQINSEKELDALRDELSSLRSRKADLEDSLLETMEQREELESLLDALRVRQEELSAKVSELTEARDAAATDIDADLERRRADRERVAADVPGEVLRYYDDLRDRKAGVAVAELSGKTCMGCRLALTAVELEEVAERSQHGLARCEQCGRIIVPT